MIKNNKGVTLVELLIVIVVMGIIAAFAIPAVGTIIDNTQKDAIVADAIAVDNASNLYCAQTTCGDTEELTWALLKPYITRIDGTYYEFDVTPSAGDVTGDVVISTNSAAGWSINLQAFDNVNDIDWDTMVLDTSSTVNRANVDAE